MTRSFVPPGGVRPRRAEGAVRTALDEARVVLIQGARQVGKSTLAKLIGDDQPDSRFQTLDHPGQRQAATADPMEFVRAPGLLVIDEIQRVPDLLLPIKLEVDAHPRPGRFLLTGSAQVLALRSVPDALPGRMQTIELWPFSQGEIDDHPDGFVEAIFRHGPELSHDTDDGREDYVERIVRGGYPEAVARSRPASRRRFFTSYLGDMTQRQVLEIGAVRNLQELRTILSLLAGRAGGLLVVESIASDVKLAASTVRRYVSLLEELFLIKTLPAWSRNFGTRLVSTPKVYFVDSGVAATLLNQHAGSLSELGSAHLGSLMENFVVSEIARQLSWSDEPVELFHYRTREQVEVDLLLHHPHHGIVGVEVKASSSVRSEDFRGLRHLADRLGDEFIAGIVLYTGQETLSFGPKLRCMPVSTVWEVVP